MRLGGNNLELYHFAERRLQQKSFLYISLSLLQMCNITGLLIAKTCFEHTLVQNQQNGNVITQIWSLLKTAPSIRRRDIVLLC